MRKAGTLQPETNMGLRLETETLRLELDEEGRNATARDQSGAETGARR